MNPKTLMALCLFLSTLSSFAQDKNPLINSGELIKKGVALHDEGKYKEALELYNKIEFSDTNYVRALYERAMTCEADSQFQEALATCEEAMLLAEDKELEPLLYTAYGSILDNLDQKERALKVLDSAIVKYPAYINFYINKATTFIRMERFADAEKVLQEAVLIEPTSSTAHFKLGIASMQQGKSVQAFLAFMTSLLIRPEGKYNKSCITLLNSISKSQDGILEFIKARKESMPESFVLVEQIVLSKIALDPKYKSLIRLDDPISRQLQVILEKIEFDQDDKDFYMQYYVPLYKKFFKDGKFEILVNHSFAGTNISSIVSYVKKNKKEEEALVNEAVAYFALIRSTREVLFNARKAEGIIYHYLEGSLFGKGVSTNGGKTITGSWVFYYPEGSTKAIGAFDSQGEKQGVWKYYHFNGQLRGHESYKNGKQEGEERFYYNNGNLASHCSYTAGEAEGVNTRYFRMGGVNITEFYTHNKLNGVRKTFYKTGGLRTVENYVNDVLNGTTSLYYENGKLEREGIYSKGKLNGPYRWHHVNGKLAGEGSYTDNEQSGTWKRYHANGQLKSIENYANGKLEGEYSEYHQNGQLFTKYLNRKGKTSGEVSYYAEDGKLYSILIFENDKLKTSKYFDKTGKQISISETEGRKLQQENYDAEGFRWRSALYNEKGNLDGTCSYYFSSGTLRKTETLFNGVETGSSVTYYPNKKKSYEMNLKEGKKDGYYISYYIHGAKEYEGWYQEDESEGTWLFYNARGNMSEKRYYRNDDLDGIKTSYFPNGKVNSEARYEMGYLRSVTQYDTTGKVSNHVSLQNGKGAYKMLHLNGKTRFEGAYVNGNLHGIFNYYFFDGSLETKGFYKYGLMDSTYRDYYYGNILHIEGRYELGDKAGTWKYYTKGGKLSYTEDFENGQLHGKRVYYYLNGKIDTESCYENGTLHGLHKKYTEDGILIFQLRYHDGDYKGYSYLDKNSQPVPEIPILGSTAKIKTLFPNGNTSAVFEYVDGKMVGPDNHYHVNGKLSMESTEVYGSTEGALKRYHPDGTLEAEFNYLHDNLDGRFVLKTDKGVVEEEGNYYNGEPHGAFKYYDAQGKLKETHIYYYGALLDVKK
ncbi:MAG: tetratricopeptide repeat protein [Chitinophagaceae bacterium]|nr:tetratricopeptide repeat protein [Chitinophagaceae bacterium]